MAQSTKISEVEKVPVVEKSPEATKNIKVAKSTEVEKSPQTANLSEYLLNTWAKGLDLVCTSQKELEDRFLQALEIQKESWEKVNNNLSQIEEGQKKLYEDIVKSTKSNLQSISRQSGNSVINQFDSQIDIMSNGLQKLTLKPYKESLSLFIQSQDQFKQSVQNYFEQQQATREEFKNQIKSTQQTYFDFYEKNMKLALGFIPVSAFLKR